MLDEFDIDLEIQMRLHHLADKSDWMHQKIDDETIDQFNRAQLHTIYGDKFDDENMSKTKLRAAIENDDELFVDAEIEIARRKEMQQKEAKRNGH